MKMSFTLFFIALLCSISCNLIIAKTVAENKSFLGLKVKAFISGKFSFVRQSNFDQYLIAEDVGMIKRNVLSHEKPDIAIEEDGGNFKISFISTLKTINLSFKVGTRFNADLGFDVPSNFLPITPSPNIIQLKDVKRPNRSIEFNFSEEGLIIVYTAKGVVATRMFKRLS
jgi:hypothetical protein